MCGDWFEHILLSAGVNKRIGHKFLKLRMPFPTYGDFQIASS